MDHLPPPILDYAAPRHRTHRTVLRWTLVEIACIAGSLAAGHFAYQPMLAFLARGVQIQAHDGTEFLNCYAVFLASMLACGAAIATRALITHHCRRPSSLWPWLALFVCTFIALALVALILLRAGVQQQIVSVPVGVGGSTATPFLWPRSLPLFRVPLAGCAAVGLLAGLLISMTLLRRPRPPLP